MNILIVDDMEVFRRQLKRLSIWKDERFNLKFEASDGKEALDIILNEEVDLMIADIKMPIINGLELLKEISDLNLPLKTILLSEHNDFAFARNAIQYGAFDYLLKPVVESELVSSLEKAYESMEKSKENKSDKLYYEDINSLVQVFLKDSDDFIKFLDSFLLKSPHISNGENINKSLNQIYRDLIFSLNRNFPWISLYIDYTNDIVIHFPPCEKSEKYIIIKNKLMPIKEKIDLLYMESNNLRTQAILTYILKNIDSIKDINSIAEEFYLSKNHLAYIFKEDFNITLGNYISKIKIERAKFLIDQGLRNFEVSEILNYSGSDYFEKLFKKYTSLTPSEYRSRKK